MSNWASEARNSQAFRVVAILAVVFLFALSFRGERQKLLRTEQTSATITDIKVTETMQRAGTVKSMTYTVSVRLEDGRRLMFMLLRAPPKVGTVVPIDISIYDSGKKEYGYSFVEWMMLK